MECTQRLECTQDLYSSQSEKVLPEQIGFLGICGTKYPVKKGPNKIGRDPQTCSIVLNLNSISRQHAVINILNNKDFMLMDLDSANKTKLESKTLPPFIPHPLQNGNTVQFGDIFGIFRLLEEECDLPMTQALDIPDTPVFSKHVSKLYNAPKTLVPESPDVSDKEESFIVPSQKLDDGKNFKSPRSRFIKPSGKTISIQPIGGKKIDNVYWNSSKKSLSLDASDLSVNSSRTSDIEENVDKPKDLHELETQVPFPKDDDEIIDSIHSANTQLPQELSSSPSIHDMSTQLPVLTEKLPQVCKISNQEEMQCDLFTANKENENIFSAETQQLVVNKEKILKDSIFDAETQEAANTSAAKFNIHNCETQPTNLIEPSNYHFFDAETQQIADDFKEIVVKPPEKEIKKTDPIDDEILFDEIDGDSFEENFESQNILPENIHISPGQKYKVENIDIPVSQPDDYPISQPIRRKDRKVIQIDSDNSTDCEDIDIVPTQQIFDKDENETDCEDNVESNKSNKNASENITKQMEEDFNDMATQILEEEEIAVCKLSNKSSNTSFNEMPTQEIENANTPEKYTSFAEAATQIIFEDDITVTNEATKKTDEVNPFKVPVVSPLKYKKKDYSKQKQVTPKRLEVEPSTSKNVVDDEIYYAATQEIFDDLCSQKDLAEDNHNVDNPKDDDRVPCSVEDLVGPRFPFLDGSPKKNFVKQTDKSSESDGDDVNKYVSSLSSTQIKDVIGVDSTFAKLRKTPSDPSDLEMTPKKIMPLKFMNIDLPDSQEIKTSVSRHCQSLVTESSSESENEQFSEECTPILFKKKKKKKSEIDAKADLMKRFEIENLPSRVITRVRKPTARFLLTDDNETKKLAEKLLKPKLSTGGDNVDCDIITENITRLKSKTEKNKQKKEAETPSTKSINVTTAKSPLIENIKLQEPTVNKENDGTKKESKSKRKDTRSKQKVKEETKEEEKSTTKTLEETKAKSTITSAKSSDTKTKSKPASEDANTERRRRRSKKDIKTEKQEDDKEATSKRSRRHKEEKTEEAKKVIQTRSILKRSSAKSPFEQSTVLKPKLSTGDDNVDCDIITENITRLKSKTEKNKQKKEAETPSTKSINVTTAKSPLIENIKLQEPTVNKENDGTKKESKSKRKDTRSKQKVKEETKEEEKSTTKTLEETKAKSTITSAKSSDTKTKSKPASEDANTERRRRRSKKDIKTEKQEDDKEATSKRSRRHKEEKTEEAKKVIQTRSILKRSSAKSPFEQSTVYNISSESDTLSPSLKRQGPAITYPASKKSRSMSGNNTSLRSTPARGSDAHKVLFTAFSPEALTEVKGKLEELGAKTVTDVIECTVLVTLQIKRTFKLLCAVGLGRPIVGPNWVQACVDSNTLVDPWQYIIKDEGAEKRFGFRLLRTLTGKREYLRGCRVSSTKSVLPSAPEMKLIVECSGGMWGEGGAGMTTPWVCVSSVADREQWGALRARGAHVVSTEFILAGVLRQKCDIDGNKLL